MTSKRKAISVARVLIALAWADGEISHDEMNFLKDFLFKFDLTGEEWAQIEMYLEEPVTPQEAHALIQDLLAQLDRPGDRQAVLSSLENLMHADGVISPQEHSFLEGFLAALQGHNTPAALFNLMKGLFRQTVLEPVAGSPRSTELHDFLNNRILFKVRRKMERENLAIEAHPDELAYATLFGGLLAYVASVHQPLGTQAFESLRQHLKQVAAFGEEAVELILSVIQETPASSLDRFRLTREFYQRSTHAQRLELLDCLFDIAGSDSDLRHSEVEEVRAIARALKLSHHEFIQAKQRYLQRLKTDRPA